MVAVGPPTSITRDDQHGERARVCASGRSASATSDR
jgi:hypothetical protein